MSAIGNEKNTTIIFPVPVDVMSAFFGDSKNDAKPPKRGKSPSPRKPEEEEGSTAVANEAETAGDYLLRKRSAKRKRGSLIQSEHVVSPPNAFSSGYSLANMMECVIDIDAYESTYL